MAPTKTVEIEVIEAPNQAPEAGDDIVNTAYGQAVEFNAFANDNDSDGIFTLNGFDFAEHGTLTHLGDGHFKYEPDPGFSGTEIIHYTIVENDGALATAEMKIVVGKKPKEAAEAGDDAYTFRD